ncbi:hypothetical protein D3C87_1233560 [compost metagenome]
MPMKWSGREIAAASLVIEIDEVFDATITCAPTMLSICLRILSFSSWFSVAASMTISAFLRSS